MSLVAVPEFIEGWFPSEVEGWYYQKWVQFPKAYKYVLGQQISDLLIEMMTTIAEARYTKNKAKLLRAAQRQLEKLRWLFRLAKDLQCITIKGYEQSSRHIVEIGQMLGGWEKSVSRGGSFSN